MNSQIAGFRCVRTRVLCDVYTDDTGVGFVSSCCSVQGRRSWYLGGLTTWKYAAGVRVCFDSVKYHILSFKTVAILCNLHNKKDERLASKMEGKTNFSMRLKQFGGLTWLTLTILLFSDRSTSLTLIYC